MKFLIRFPSVDHARDVFQPRAMALLAPEPRDAECGEFLVDDSVEVCSYHFVFCRLALLAP